MSSCVQQLVASDGFGVLGLQPARLPPSAEVQIDQLYKLLDESIKDVLLRLT